MPQMSVRIKRKDLTVFLTCTPSDSMRKLKMRLADLVKQPVDNLVLTAPDKTTVLPDAAALSDHGITDDQILYLTFGGEPVDVKELSAHVPHHAGGK